MMEYIPLRQRLEIYRKTTNVRWDIIEQDYILAWVLFGISQINELKETLVFKGGTALKKCYFGDYRFSQDLDFSVRGNYPCGESLLRSMQLACDATNEALKKSEEVVLKCERYSERKPHPELQEAFTFSARFPWQREFHTKALAEVTLKENVLLEPKEKFILHDYGEALESSLYVYPLEEIIAEKIRAILQFSKKVFERGWGRSRVRDYYDLWRILSEYGDAIDPTLVPSLVFEKCRVKDIMFEGVNELFTPKLMSIISQDWDRWLGMTVPELPNKDMVINALKEKLDDVFMNRNTTEDQSDRC